MGGSDTVAQGHAGVELALSELKLAHSALDTAEATTEVDVRRDWLSMSRKAHTLAMRYLAELEASEEERRSFQAQLRWLEVRLEKMNRGHRGRAMAS